VATFDGWLYRILVGTAADEASKRRRFRANDRTLFVEPSDNGANDPADRELMERAFARLSLEHRAVVVLRHYADLPLADVAHAVLPPGGVRSPGMAICQEIEHL
jgi:DNA-directed RNA polymerase specialized sigma24 family protein